MSPSSRPNRWLPRGVAGPQTSIPSFSRPFNHQSNEYHPPQSSQAEEGSGSAESNWRSSSLWATSSGQSILREYAGSIASVTQDGDSFSPGPTSSSSLDDTSSTQRVDAKEDRGPCNDSYLRPRYQPASLVQGYPSASDRPRLVSNRSKSAAPTLQRRKLHRQDAAPRYPPAPGKASEGAHDSADNRLLPAGWEGKFPEPPPPWVRATRGTFGNGNMRHDKKRAQSVPSRGLQTATPTTAAATATATAAATASASASKQPSGSTLGSTSSSAPAPPRNVDEARSAMMAMWLYQRQLQKRYIGRSSTGSEGVVLKVTKNAFTCCPAELRNETDGLFEMVQQMNVRAAMTVNSIVVRALLAFLNDRRRDEDQAQVTGSEGGSGSGSGSGSGGGGVGQRQKQQLQQRPRHRDSVPLAGGLQVQVLKTMADLPGCSLHHFAAFIESRALLVVWDDDPKQLFARAELLEDRAMALIWGGDSSKGRHKQPGDRAKSPVDPQHLPGDSGTPDPGTEEEGRADPNHRPVRLASSCMLSLALLGCVTMLGVGWRSLVRDSLVDDEWQRLGVLAVTPATFWVSLFFFYSLVSNMFLMFGSNYVVKTNSKYYSGVPPWRASRDSSGSSSSSNGDGQQDKATSTRQLPTLKQPNLPHVTIQMPVYKEGLHAVIRPTVMSLKTAISTYEMQGGTASIFVNDDGMQLLSRSKAQERRDFYEEHNIGWVARPPHNPPPAKTKKNQQQQQQQQQQESTGIKPHFVRRGKFKKASNMNHALHLSQRVEDKLRGLLPIFRPRGWTAAEEDAAYKRSLAAALRDDGNRTWADGNIRVGPYILLVDCDTRVPADCLLDAVNELEASPEVAILQFTSGVMTLTDSFFERGIAWFGGLIYSAITFAVASGDACPFVGHNAFLRWEALQDAAVWKDERDGYDKFWSESHVSEDFDMAIRLQLGGWTLRYASYTGTASSASPSSHSKDHHHSSDSATAATAPSNLASPSSSFQEGVSLTVYDELNRWEKYAYGCSELVFNPLSRWPRKGPLSRNFRRFLWSRHIRLPVKLTVCSYIGSYYAVALAWPVSLFNYLFMGWFAGGVHLSYYVDSFSIYVSLLVVFPFLGNIALAVHRYRLRQRPLLSGLWENLKWVPLFMIFLGGISMHLSQAVLAHLLGVEMTWDATKKELEDVAFGEEMGRVLGRFRWTFLFVFLGVSLIIACRFCLPRQWQIDDFFAIYPFAAVLFSHFALPVFLNPALMTFTW